MDGSTLHTWLDSPPLAVSLHERPQTFKESGGPLGALFRACCMGIVESPRTTTLKFASPSEMPFVPENGLETTSAQFSFSTQQSAEHCCSSLRNQCFPKQQMPWGSARRISAVPPYYDEHHPIMPASSVYGFFDVVVQEGRKNDKSVSPSYRAILSFPKPGLMQIVPMQVNSKGKTSDVITSEAITSEASTSEASTSEANATQSLHTGYTLLSSYSVKQNESGENESAQGVGETGPLTTLLYASLALIHKACAALFGGRVCQRRENSGLASPLLSSTLTTTSLLDHQQHHEYMHKNAEHCVTTPATETPRKRDNSSGFCFEVSKTYLLHTTARSIVLQTPESSGPSYSSSKAVLALRARTSYSTKLLLDLLQKEGVKQWSIRQEKRNQVQKNGVVQEKDGSNSSRKATLEYSNDCSSGFDSSEKLEEKQNSSIHLSVSASETVSSRHTDSFVVPDAKRTLGVPETLGLIEKASSPAISQEELFVSFTTKKPVTAVKSTLNKSETVLDETERIDSTLPLASVTTLETQGLSEDVKSREGGNEGKTTQATKQTEPSLALTASVPTIKTEQLFGDDQNTLKRSNFYDEANPITQKHLSTEQERESRQKDDSNRHSLTQQSNEDCLLRSLDDAKNDFPLLKPLGIVGGLGVGAIAVVSERMRRKRLARYCKAKSVLSGSCVSDYSYTSFLTGSYPARRCFGLYASHFVPGNEQASPSATAASVSGLLHHLRERQHCSFADAEKDTEAANTSRGSLPDEQHQNAAALLDHVYKPLGRAAQHVVLSDWERIEDEDCRLLSQQHDSSMLQHDNPRASQTTSTPAPPDLD